MNQHARRSRCMDAKRSPLAEQRFNVDAQVSDLPALIGAATKAAWVACGDSACGTIAARPAPAS